MDHFVKTVKLLNFAIITFLLILPILEKVKELQIQSKQSLRLDGFEPSIEFRGMDKVGDGCFTLVNAVDDNGQIFV